MEIKEFKKLAINLDNFTAKEVDEFELMDIEELEEYQNELERDSGNYSNWDHIRALFTMKSKMLDFLGDISSVEEKPEESFLEKISKMDLSCKGEEYEEYNRMGWGNNN